MDKELEEAIKEAIENNFYPKDYIKKDCVISVETMRTGTPEDYPSILENKNE